MPRIKNAQVFDWNDPDTGQTYCFAVSWIISDMLNGDLQYDHVISPMDPKFCKEWIEQRGVDIDYAIRKANDLTWLNTPVITLMQRDGSGLMVDGQHRFAANYMLGKTAIHHFIIQYPLWLKYRNDSGLWRKVV